MPIILGRADNGMRWVVMYEAIVHLERLYVNLHVTPRWHFGEACCRHVLEIIQCKCILVVEFYNGNVSFHVHASDFACKWYGAQGAFLFCKANDVKSLGDFDYNVFAGLRIVFWALGCTGNGCPMVMGIHKEDVVSIVAYGDETVA